MTAAAAGFAMPPEWSPQEAVWLSWPCNRESAPETHVALQAKFGEIAATASRFETVRINAAGEWRDREGHGYNGRIEKDDPVIDAVLGEASARAANC